MIKKLAVLLIIIICFAGCDELLAESGSASIFPAETSEIKVQFQTLSGISIGIGEISKENIGVKIYSYYQIDDAVLPPLLRTPYTHTIIQMEVTNNSDSDIALNYDTSFKINTDDCQDYDWTYILYTDKFLFPVKLAQAKGFLELPNNTLTISKNSIQNCIFTYKHSKSKPDIFQPFKLFLSVNKVSDNKKIEFEIKFNTESKGFSDPKENTLVREYKESSCPDMGQISMPDEIMKSL